jgi:hypothetical protein
MGSFLATTMGGALWRDDVCDFLHDLSFIMGSNMLQGMEKVHHGL